MWIRPYEPRDLEPAAGVCLRTADAGGDATGVFDDDELWSLVFLRPYLARHPDLAWVVETADERVVGYIVGTDDTEAFEDWFHGEWWPPLSARFPLPPDERSRQDGTVRYAYGRRAGAEPYAARGYPGHLHIDLLPEAQGIGWGRRLIETMCDAQRRRGVAGVHLVADLRNTGALAFYDRVGFIRLASHAGVQAFGRRLR